MILHIVSETEWRTAVAAGRYEPPSLADEGFIHCSTIAQVLGPANDFYHAQSGLQLLGIDPERVAAPIVYEDCYESGQAFPHIYGPLNPDAVTAIFAFPPEPDGSFVLPQALRDIVRENTT